MIAHKRVLVTGGTGSFGNVVVKRFLGLKPKQVVIFSRDEKKQHDMRNYYSNRKLRFVVGDVRDKESVKKTMKGMDFVFHAAALKQVPTAEFFPLEAIKTNTLGASNVISSAVESGVKRVVILSTDKAVYPINAMGMSKALMEKIMIAESRNLTNSRNGKTILCGVRYGNVLYTRGSVIPYFVNLIKGKKALPVTDLKMTRFLLTQRGSVDLVLHALRKGKKGYMYVRKSPACTMETLAKALCQIFKHKPGYKEIGIRAGEKMHETLLTSEEMLRAKVKGNYYEVPPESQGLEYRKYFVRGKKLKGDQLVPFTSENTKRLSVAQTIRILVSLPEIKEELKSLKIL
jgi:UDP-glucose 4-epimerase